MFGSTSMTLREMNVRVFERKPIPQIFFQPRFEPWFELHEANGTLPEFFRGKTVYEAYQGLGVSMRYIHCPEGTPGPITICSSPKLSSQVIRTDHGHTTVISTPEGELVTRYATTNHGCRIVEYPVRTPGDLRKLEWYFRNLRFEFNPQGFQAGADLMGDLGEPQFFVPRSPYQTLIMDWMRYEDLVYLLYEMPEVIENVALAINDSHDPLYAGLAQSQSVRIINFGENIDGNLLSPSIFERFHLPFYEKRATQLRNAGIHTTIHLDGSMRPILPYLAKLPVDGLEALTPTPQGDVTLDELHLHMGDKILLDGIPALYFMEEFSLEILQECVERIVDLFGTRLVLGISDELPMGAGPEAFDRLVWVRDYCRTHTTATA